MPDVVPDFIACSGPKPLPHDLIHEAARLACECFPANAPLAHHLPEILAPGVSPPLAIALLTTKYWGPDQRTLTVSFMEAPSQQLADKIVGHMNAWRDKGCGIGFKLVSGRRGDVRITLSGVGYWSTLGTDSRLVPMDQPTMSLQGFGLRTPESEYRRVVRHETGHELGFTHEHMQRKLIARLDRAAVIADFKRTQGWSERMIVEQIFTPLDERSIMATPADQTSIMCYQFRPELTLDHLGIPGGTDINPTDEVFGRKVYPGAGGPTGPGPTGPAPPPSTGAPSAVELMDRMDAERRGAGLAALRMSGPLNSAALAGVLALAHPGHGGADLAARVAAEGYAYASVGENIASDQRSAAAVLAAWMGDEPRKANVLSPSFTDFGASVVETGSGRVFWCAVFGKPR